MDSASGEIQLKLGGRTYVLRPGFGAMMEVETTTGKGVLELFQLAGRGRLPFTDVARIVHACIKNGLREGDLIPTFESIGEHCYKAGFLKLRDPVIGCLAHALNQGVEIAEKKTSPAESEPTESTSTASSVSPSASVSAPQSSTS